MTSHEEAVKKLNEEIKGVRIAMLTTQAPNGDLHSRPMATQSQDFDGSLWFFTEYDSGKTAELEANPNVNLAYADPSDNRYVSVTGTARVVREEAKMRELWQEPLRAWFPKGLDDPQLALLQVEVSGAEYWDSPSRMMVVLGGYLKAVTTGKRAEGGENEKLEL
ncbi:MAG: pyridoxamine 5'-phosphate oxidase family protein [Deinococcota bacterium]|nr:pyridoxamine 5'-phosphate oxidase family protein [Deinococcota bacterium]